MHLHARATILWVYLGDFNEILHFTKKQGRLPKPLAPMLAFKETLLQCGLEDLGFQGPHSHGKMAFQGTLLCKKC